MNKIQSEILLALTRYFGNGSTKYVIAEDSKGKLGEYLVIVGVLTDNETIYKEFEINSVGNVKACWIYNKEKFLPPEDRSLFSDVLSGSRVF